MPATRARIRRGREVVMLPVQAFLPLLFGYLGAEAWFAVRRWRAGAGEAGPWAAAWAWRAVGVTLVAIYAQFQWPVFLL